MEKLASWICLAAALLASARGQLQLLGNTVVDENFFVVGELHSGETFDQFKRRLRQENPSAAADSGLIGRSDPEAPRVPAAGSSTEPLGLASGASEVLGRIDESFSCEGLPYGYYSDSSNDCRVYHVCNPGQAGTQTNQYSFFCNAGTEFDQRLLTCVHDSPDRSGCTSARQFYESSNSQFFRDVGFSADASPASGGQTAPESADGQVVLIGVTGGVPVNAVQPGGQVDVPSVPPQGERDDFINTDGAGLIDLRFGLPNP